MRYGFAVDDNAEPDGSSNDVFPLEIVNSDDTKTVVELRVASRAKYTYRPLANALDALKQKRGRGPRLEGVEMNDRSDAVVGGLEDAEGCYGGWPAREGSEDAEDDIYGGGNDEDEDDAYAAEMYGEAAADTAGDKDIKEVRFTGSGMGRAGPGVLKGTREVDDVYGAGRGFGDDECEDVEDDEMYARMNGEGGVDEEGDDDMYAEMYGEGVVDGEEENDDDEPAANESFADEVAALSDLVALLQEKVDAIPEDLTLASGSSDSRVAHCATLLLSERLTLSFFRDVAAKCRNIAEEAVLDGNSIEARIAKALSDLGGELDEPGDEPPLGVSGRNAMLWRVGEGHVNALVRVYFRVRHGVK
jgi:hypothetical protein